MKKNKNISTLFTAFMAVLLLFVFTFSGVFVRNVAVKNISEQSISKKAINSKKSDKKSDNHNNFYFSKTSIEAVFSPIVPSLHCEAVTFYIPEYSFLKIELPVKVIQSFASQYHLEILFEHLIAPNAP